MQDSVYNSLFGALTQKYTLDLIANNLANVNTPGYKKEKISFKDVLTHYAHDFLDPNKGIKGGVRWPEKDLLTQPRIDQVVTDFSQGELIKTGNPLSLAIEGKGFFKVQTEEGIMYSRGGNFQLDSNGYIITNQGYQLLGQNGPIQVPTSQNIQITPDGILFSGNDQIDIIPIVNFEDPQKLKKIGGGLYKAEEGVQEIPAEDVKIFQGYIESSNVEVATELVNMLETLRIFEALQKTMTNTNDQDRNLISKMGRTE